LARRFLYLVALLIALAVAAMIGFSFFGNGLLQAVLTPRVPFTVPAALPPGYYGRAEGWFSRPDGRKGDAANWQPPGAEPLPSSASRPGAAIFFIHPTSSFDPLRWNAGTGDRQAIAQAERFLRLQASAFAPSGRIWAPRYRQAQFGAFLTDKPESARAIDLAYGDVATAFEAFLAANPDGPLILAGHSQGTLHLIRLLAERVGGLDWRPRLVAAYAVGWPISVRHDLPALALPACTAARQTGCILSWQSFAPPADTTGLEAHYTATPALDGASRKASPMLCTNPLTGGAGGAAGSDRNRGLLMGDGGERSTQLSPPGAIGAHCTPAGILMLDKAPALGPMLLPGNNYHVYDYALFWANVRDDARERLAAWQMTH
jgi:hypothetical protein